MTFQPTPEQAAIVHAAKTTSTNLLLTALAGAAKTSTLELICNAITDIPILSIAFNKRIADEMKARLPAHVKAQTINSLGHSVWGTAIGKKLIIDTKKTFNLLKEVLDDLPRGDRKEMSDSFSETMKMVSSAKLNGYIPEGKYLETLRLISTQDFWDSFDEEPSDLQKYVVNQVLVRSISDSYSGKIDFDDQVYMSTIFGGQFPRYPLVLIDEAQDLSPLNHAMLKKLVVKRLIAVGDSFQSIYAFRGAASDSMARLKESFQMQEMTLTISFRCPKEIIRAAWFRAPEMKWPDWAIEGEIHSLDGWSAQGILDGSAIICRNNAPLFKCALNLIRLGRGVKLVGSDIGPQLIKALKKLGEPAMTRPSVLEAITRWESEHMRKAKSKAAIADKAACLRVFAGFGNTLGEAIGYAEHLFASAGPILLMSGHKAKGLEFDYVYFLDEWRIPSVYAETVDEVTQEDNLRYVVLTRAKKALYYVDTETLT